MLLVAVWIYHVRYIHSASDTVIEKPQYNKDKDAFFSTVEKTIAKWRTGYSYRRLFQVKIISVAESFNMIRKVFFNHQFNN